MIFSTALAVLSFSGAVSALTYGGTEYAYRFNSTSSYSTVDIKTGYQKEAAKQAGLHLKKQIQRTGIDTDCLAKFKNDDLASVKALRVCVAAHNPTDFFDILADDIEAANKFWTTVVDQSTTDRSLWKPARAYVKGYYNGTLDAVRFATWTLSPAADAANFDANPEHYFKETVPTSPTTAESEIFEGWGGVYSSFGTIRTNFTVPAYTVPVFGTPDVPQAWAISSAFPSVFQRGGPKLLTSGSKKLFGYLHIAVRDFAETDAVTGAPVTGIEIYSAVWYPPWDKANKSKDTAEFVNNYLKDEAVHMVNEAINLSNLAAKQLAAPKA